MSYERMCALRDRCHILADAANWRGDEESCYRWTVRGLYLATLWNSLWADVLAEEGAQLAGG